MREAPYGYKLQDGRLVPDELEKEVVKWIFDRYIKYSEHPPETLVNGVIEEFKISKNMDISYEEAEKMVSSDRIHQYMDQEQRLRIKAFKAFSKDESADDLKYYLECPLETLDKKEIIDTYNRKVGENPWASRNKNVFVGEIKEKQ